MVTGGAGGSVNGSGLYSAPATSGTSTIKVTDALGNTATSTVTINSALAITPSTYTLAVNNTKSFSGTGGVGAYTYSVVAGGAGGTVNGSGLYTAPATGGTDTVKVADTLGNTATSTITINPAMTITPSTFTMAVSNTKSFSGAGGVGAYTYSVVSGGAGGTVNSSGLYTAPATSGTDTVKVTDTLGNAATSTVTINPALTITPATFTLAVNDTKSFSGSGGVSPYTYSMVIGGAGGSVNSSGLYTAPISAGTATVKITDALGNTATSVVTINPAVTITPTSVTLAVSNTKSFSGSGGVGTYTYSVASGGAGGTVNSSGLYTAPATSGTDTVKITDTLGNSATSTVTINPALAISPIFFVTFTGGSTTFTATGGVGGNTYSATIGSIASSTGVFTAPNAAGTGSIKVTDSYGNTSTATVFVISRSLLAGPNMGDHGCGVSTSAGNVYCWGYNNDGQLGINTTTTSKTPVEVLGVGGSGDLSGIVSVTAGQYFTCGLSSAGNVYCWGLNTDGQLGINTTTNSKTPVEVLGVGGSGNLSGMVMLAGGGDHTCALSTAGNVYCWGYNNDSQLGNNSTTTELEPIEVLGVGGSGNLASIVSIAAGQYHTCAVSSAGNVYCWGYNNKGQLGNNTTTTELVPIEVLGVGGSGNLSGIQSITAGQDHTCAVSSAGNVYCWGYNVDGQLGNNSTTTSKTPIEVLGVGGSGNLSGIVRVTAGQDHTCAVSSAGNVYCWGNNADGQLGNNSTTTSETPIEVLGVGGSGDLSGMSSITAGVSQSCALSTSGNVYCWGDNADGQLGNNTTTTELEPIEVLGVGGSGNLSGI